MQIIVAGCGKVGSQFARIMSEEGHEIAVVDSSSENFKLLGSGFHGVTVLGVPIDEDVLKEAGIESADGFAAVTPDDNINMMACQIAKEIFRVPRIFARIQDPVKEQVFYQFGVHTVCPTDMAVQEFRALMMGESSTKTHFIDNTGIEFIYERIRDKDTGKLMRDISLPKNAHLLGVMKDGQLNFYNPAAKLEFDDELVIVSKI
ncbi:MAG TPA: TrkA family potassium uptake protein [Anaerovoracaceae bacterium]|nr:TrkA family potassium uptake protein [Anaerovoracaceae bacterium]